MCLGSDGRVGKAQVRPHLQNQIAGQPATSPHPQNLIAGLGLHHNLIALAVAAGLCLRIQIAAEFHLRKLIDGAVVAASQNHGGPQGPRPHHVVDQTAKTF
ncbi:hypothetical protein SLEP1_g19251 [Rubroshorea leprosula]|nr:hypothetical protein SLEP1_g19251 [Rubroshorea leprosula]